jgi:hypothetical protein
MHRAAGVGDGARILPGYCTATFAVGAALLVFCRFAVLPHAPVGVSQAHLTLAATIYAASGSPAMHQRLYEVQAV